MDVKAILPIKVNLTSWLIEVQNFLAKYGGFW